MHVYKYYTYAYAYVFVYFDDQKVASLLFATIVHAQLDAACQGKSAGQDKQGNKSATTMGGFPGKGSQERVYLLSTTNK